MEWDTFRWGNGLSIHAELRSLESPRAISAADAYERTVNCVTRRRGGSGERGEQHRVESILNDGQPEEATSSLNNMSRGARGERGEQQHQRQLHHAEPRRARRRGDCTGSVRTGLMGEEQTGMRGEVGGTFGTAPTGGRCAVEDSQSHEHPPRVCR